MGATVLQTSTTFDDFLKLPNPPTGHFELHHGEVVHMPPPKRGHQRIQRRILALLIELAGKEGVAETEMAFRPTPGNEVWVADVGFVKASRDQNTADDEYLNGAPDLVVEVMSPSNTWDELNDKIDVCMSNGCLSFWIVDPKRKVVSVFTEGDVSKVYRESASIPLPEPLKGTISVAAIFSV
jgi:Uma2 family endonuclease